MAHEISEVNGVAEAAFAYQPAWHGLGKVLPGLMTAQEALDAAHLRWQVVEKPLYFDGGKEVPDRKAMFREDTGLYLGTVGSDWVAVQNEEQARFLEALVGAGAIVDCAGALRQGRRTFWTVRSPKDLVIGGEDRIQKYLILCNGHDGSLAFRAFWSPIRVVCANTLNAALGRSHDGVALFHRSKVHDHLNEARRILGLARDYYEALGKNFEIMLAKAFSDAEFKVFVDEVFPLEKGREDHTPMTIGARRAVAENFREGRGHEIAGRTAWGAYNAVTEYLGHQKEYKSRERRFENLLLGGPVRETQQRAFKVAMEMAAH